MLVEHSNSVVSFGVNTEGYGQHHNRFLAIDGTEAIDLGFPCDSCTFLFQRVSTTSLALSPHVVSSRLNEGVETLDDDVIDAVSTVLPTADYLAVLTTIQPRLLSPGDSDDYFLDKHWQAMRRHHDPETQYYRGRRDLAVGVGSDAATFHEIAVPLYPVDDCDSGVTQDWTERLDKGERPTALAVSVLAGVSGRYSGDSHLVLTHFLLDGHHKMLAASRSGAEIGLLAFVNTEASPDNHWSDDRMRELLGSALDGP